MIIFLTGSCPGLFEVIQNLDDIGVRSYLVLGILAGS
jgi:hypothetical protein